MNDQQGFVVGVSSGGRSVEGSCDRCFVVDHGVDVIQFDSVGDAGSPNAL